MPDTYSVTLYLDQMDFNFLKGHVGKIFKLVSVDAEVAGEPAFLCLEEADGKSFIAGFELEGERWTDDEKYPMSDWQNEVSAGDTSMSYPEWVRAQHEMEDNEPDDLVSTDFISDEGEQDGNEDEPIV